MTVFVLSGDDKDQRRQNFAINELGRGRSNATGTVTLATSTTTTSVTAPTCAAGSVVLYMPTTANASAEIGAGTIRVSTVANGSFILTHANNAQTDRTFGWVAIG